VFFKTINFTKDIHIGDRISIIYEEKLRLLKRVEPPRIKSATISIAGMDHSVFYFHNRYYDENGNLLKKFRLTKPIRGQVTSSFTLKRYHPVLKRYRAHHGIDYRAKVGTKIKSSWNGRVVFAGWKGGYGRTLIIEHIDGYRTLYAHLSKFASTIHKNTLVKQGQYIANTGATGMVTGPHLHFGLYHHGKPINPNSFINQYSLALKDRDLDEFNIITHKYKYKMINASYGISDDMYMSYKD
jgi:murein DD-endopeptidase MepM/ murein hydrolase activator NlpD